MVSGFLSLRSLRSCLLARCLSSAYSQVGSAVAQRKGGGQGMDIVKRIERLKAMEHHLCPGRWGLVVRGFAEQHGISEKQVKRDLKALEKLGQTATCRKLKVEEPDVFDYVWRYDPGVKPLFACNLPRDRFQLEEQKRRDRTGHGTLFEHDEEV